MGDPKYFFYLLSILSIHTNSLLDTISNNDIKLKKYPS